MSKPLPNFNNIKHLKKLFYIKTTPVEGNCLFYALSYLIFESFNYYINIRNKICNYLFENITEIEGFSKLCNIRITCYTRFVSGDKKEHKDKINRKACGIEYVKIFNNINRLWER